MNNGQGIALKNWMRNLRESKGMTLAEFAGTLGYTSVSPVYSAERHYNDYPYYSYFTKIVKEFGVRPSDEILNTIISEAQLRGYSNLRIIGAIRRSWSYPVWMPNGEEGKKMGQELTARGETIKRMGERQPSTDADKLNGRTVELLREIQGLRKEIADLSKEELVIESQPVEPRTHIERIRERLRLEKHAEIEEQARTEAKAALYEELHHKSKELTSLRIASLRTELGNAARHCESVLSGLETLTEKVRVSQNELIMLSWSLDNSFAYLAVED